MYIWGTSFLAFEVSHRALQHISYVLLLYEEWWLETWVVWPGMWVRRMMCSFASDVSPPDNIRKRTSLDNMLHFWSQAICLLMVISLRRILLCKIPRSELPRLSMVVGKVFTPRTMRPPLSPLQARSAGGPLMCLPWERCCRQFMPQTRPRYQRCQLRPSCPSVWRARWRGCCPPITAGAPPAPASWRRLGRSDAPLLCYVGYYGAACASLLLSLSLPNDLTSSFTTLVHERNSFHADELHLMSTICELQLKPPLECIDIFTLLKEKVDLISKVCNVIVANM